MGQRFQSARTNVLQGNSDGIFAMRNSEGGIIACKYFRFATNGSFSEKRPKPGSPTRDSSPSAKLRLKSHSLMEKKNPRSSCVGTVCDKSGRRSAKHADR